MSTVLAAFLCSHLGLAAGGTAIERLEQALVEHVALRARVAEGDVEVVHLGVARLPACAEEGRFVVESPAGERFLGAADVRVVVYGPADLCTHLSLRPRVRLWVEVPVAAARTVPGDLVSWRVERRPLDGITGTAMARETLEAGPWLARTTLLAGQALTETVLRPQPDARGGQEVALLAGAGDLVVKAHGRLVADGSVGSSVAVSNFSSQTVVQGVLVTPDCVAVGPVTPRIQEACAHATLR